jgi:hypothetical protein
VKRFLLFSFNTYYPSGGWQDFFGSFDSVDAAKVGYSECKDDNCDERPEWAHIIDTETETIVAEGRYHTDGLFWAVPCFYYWPDRLQPDDMDPNEPKGHVDSPRNWIEWVAP